MKAIFHQYIGCREHPQADFSESIALVLEYPLTNTIGFTLYPPHKLVSSMFLQAPIKEKKGGGSRLTGRS